MPFIGTFFSAKWAISLSCAPMPTLAAMSRNKSNPACSLAIPFLVFPEGTFLPHEGVRPFQLGAFNAAVVTGVQIVPVSLAGTRRFLRDGTYLPRPASVTITLSPPLLAKPAEPDSSDWHEVVRLRDAAREQIARNCGEPLL